MKTTEKLTEILKKATPDTTGHVLQENSKMFAASERPFADFFRGKLKEKELKQQEVFLNADIPERYGYKLVSEQKHTRQRDVLLRLCFAAHFTLEETQRALKLSGAAPLYSRIPRDAVLMIAANNGLSDIQAVNELLINHGFEPLSPCGAAEIAG